MLETHGQKTKCFDKLHHPPFRPKVLQRWGLKSSKVTLSGRAEVFPGMLTGWELKFILVFLEVDINLTFFISQYFTYNLISMNGVFWHYTSTDHVTWQIYSQTFLIIPGYSWMFLESHSITIYLVVICTMATKWTFESYIWGAASPE